MQKSVRAVRAGRTRRYSGYARRVTQVLAACGLLVTYTPTGAGQRPPNGIFIANVADASTNAPVTDAIVEMSDVGRTARTDWIGEAHLDNIPRGRHRVTVRHIGYVPAEVEIAFTRDTVGYVFLLSPSPPVLDTVRTTAKSSVVPLRLQNFEMRRRMGIGRFLTDSVLLKERTQPIASIMARHFPGLFTVGFSQGIWRRWKGDVPCRPDTYVDGVRYGPVRGKDDPLDLRFIDGEDVAGVEYYTEVSAPAQYRRPGMICGVILIWLKYH